MTAGPLLMLLGGWPLLYIYAFASMVPPRLRGWDYWAVVLGKMFDFADAGWLSLLSSVVVFLGCVLFVWGGGVLVGDAIGWWSRHSGPQE